MKEFFTYLNKLNALEAENFDLDSQWESNGKKQTKNVSKQSVKKSVKLHENFGHDGYMYITKHGMGPGTLPKDVRVLKWKDLPHYMTAIWLDRFLTTDELKQYDIYPETQIKRVMDMYDITEDDIMGESVKIKEDYKIDKSIIEDAKDIIQNADLTVGSIDKDTDGGYIEIVDKTSGMRFWIEYWNAGSDWDMNWNQYIFYNNYEDKLRKTIQEDPDFIEWAFDIARDNLPILGESVKIKHKSGRKTLKEELSDIKQEWEEFLSDGGNNVIEFDDGDYVFFDIDFDKGTIYAGSATNTGILRQYEIYLDSHLNLDENIAELYDEICREKEQENDAWYEEHKDDIENAWEEKAISDVQSELDAEHLGESVKNKRKSNLKENKRLVEGPGAGYIVHGTIKYIDMNNIQVVKQDVDAIGEYYNVTGDIKGSLEDVSVEDYYHYINLYEEYGYDEIPITITNVVLSCFDDIDTMPDADEIRNIFEGLRFDVVIGGGWSHSTFDGTINLNAMNAGHYYSDFGVESAVIHVVDENVVDIIDNIPLINDYEDEDEDSIEESLQEDKKPKIDLYINGEYICSSHKYARAKDFIDAVKRDGKVVYAGVNKDGKLSNNVVFKIKDTDKVTARIIAEAVETDKSLEDNGLTKTTLKAIKKGTWFTFKPVEVPSENLVYVRDDYDRETRKYGYYKWSDINNWHEKKGDTVVYTGFTF